MPGPGRLAICAPRLERRDTRGRQALSSRRHGRRLHEGGASEPPGKARPGQGDCNRRVDRGAGLDAVGGTIILGYRRQPDPGADRTKNGAPEAGASRLASKVGDVRPAFVEIYGDALLRELELSKLAGTQSIHRFDHLGEFALDDRPTRCR
jgi:hypothetical protein